MENLLILLRCLNHGKKEVYETPLGEYISTEAIGFINIPTGTELRTIESRIQFELYGEYPLSPDNFNDWHQNVKQSFRL